MRDLRYRFPLSFPNQVLRSFVSPRLCRLTVILTPLGNHTVRDLRHWIALFPLYPHILPSYVTLMSTSIYLIFVLFNPQAMGPRGLTTRLLASHALLCYYLSYIAPQRFPRERGSRTPCIVIFSMWPIRHRRGFALQLQIRFSAAARACISRRIVLSAIWVAVFEGVKYLWGDIKSLWTVNLALLSILSWNGYFLAVSHFDGNNCSILRSKVILRPLNFLSLVSLV